MQAAESDYLSTPYFLGKNELAPSEEVYDPTRPEAGTQEDSLQNEHDAGLLEEWVELEKPDAFTEFTEEHSLQYDYHAASIKRDYETKIKRLKEDMDRSKRDLEGSQKRTRKQEIVTEVLGQKLRKATEEKKALTNQVTDYEDKIRKFEKQETENKDRDIALLRKLNNFLECENARLGEQRDILQYIADVLSKSRDCGSPSESKADEIQVLSESPHCGSNSESKGDEAQVLSESPHCGSPSESKGDEAQVLSESPHCGSPSESKGDETQVMEHILCQTIVLHCSVLKEF